jgi:hypothetical protein
MAGRATEIDIVLKDEVSGTATAVHAALKRVREEAKRTTPIGQKALAALERTAQNVGRELQSGILALGASSAIFSGSFVAVLANIASSLDRFADSGLKQFAVAREVGLTYEAFERLVIAAKARGISDRDARTGIERLARSVRDLQRGTESSTRDKLEEGSFRDTGTIVARELQDSLARNGLEATMLEVLRRMAAASGKGEEGRWAAEAYGEAMGLKGAAWNEMLATLEKINNVVIPSEAAAKRYKIESMKLQRTLSQISKRIISAAMPTFKRLIVMLSEYFNEKNTKKFGDQIRAVVQALLDYPWDKLRERIDRILAWVGEELVAFTGDLAAFVETIDGCIQFVNRWRENNRRGTGPSTESIQLPSQVTQDNNTPQRFSGGDDAGPLPFRTKPESDAKFDMSGILSAANVAVGSKHIEDRRTTTVTAENTGESLVDQVGKLAFEMRRFVDVLRDLRGGAGGGSSDGGVSQKARTRPMQTKGGGFGGGGASAQFNQTEDQTLAAGKPVAPGMPPAGPRSVKGSWFGNFSKQLGSQIGWDDPDDKYTSGPMKGQPKPNYGGYGQDVPGVALPYKASAGRPEAQQGAPVRVWDPRQGRPSVMARQVDIGPNQINPRSKDKGLDMNAALAERLGYAPTKKSAQETGRDVFPTGTNFKYQVLRTEDILRARTEMDQERKRIEGGAIKWTRHGQLDLEVNVKGPKGVKVDATADGDLEPSDRGININRTFTDRNERATEQQYAE